MSHWEKTATESFLQIGLLVIFEGFRKILLHMLLLVGGGGGYLRFDNYDYVFIKSYILNGWINITIIMVIIKSIT